METFKRGIYVTTKISNVFNRLSQIVFIHKIRIQYIPYRLLNKLFYKQEKLFEIYIYIFEITYKPIDKTTKTATTFNY